MNESFGTNINSLRAYQRIFSALPFASSLEVRGIKEELLKTAVSRLSYNIHYFYCQNQILSSRSVGVGFGFVQQRYCECVSSNAKVYVSQPKEYARKYCTTSISKTITVYKYKEGAYSMSM